MDVAVSLNLASSTIRSIIKNTDKIKPSATTTFDLLVKTITRIRNNVIEVMKKRLSIWVDDENQWRIPLSQLLTIEKVKSIFKHIQDKTDNRSKTFGASRGWFDRFKKRTNLHSIRITSEAVSADIQAVEEFKPIQKSVIERGGYPPKLVFNVDKTGLFGKGCHREPLFHAIKNMHLDSKQKKQINFVVRCSNAKGENQLYLFFGNQTIRLE